MIDWTHGLSDEMYLQPCLAWSIVDSRMDTSNYFQQNERTRREFLARCGQGFGSLALSAMLVDDGFCSPSPIAAGAKLSAYHHPPRAKRVVQLFMGGAASHLDTFDYKPALEKRHGEKSDFGEPIQLFQNGLGPWMKLSLIHI